MQGVAKWQRACLGNTRLQTEPISGGTVPKSQINPLAAEAMMEIGIDIGTQKPKELSEDMIKDADKVINMGCMDKNFCPTLFVPKVLDW